MKLSQRKGECSSACVRAVAVVVAAGEGFA
jgi:hypothetical protein